MPCMSCTIYSIGFIYYGIESTNRPTDIKPRYHCFPKFSIPKVSSVRGGHCNVSEDTAVPTMDVTVSAVFCKILS